MSWCQGDGRSGVIGHGCGGAGWRSLRRARTRGSRGGAAIQAGTTGRPGGAVPHGPGAGVVAVALRRRQPPRVHRAVRGDPATHAPRPGRRRGAALGVLHRALGPHLQVHPGDHRCGLRRAGGGGHRAPGPGLPPAHRRHRRPGTPLQRAGPRHLLVGPRHLPVRGGATGRPLRHAPAVRPGAGGALRRGGRVVPALRREHAAGPDRPRAGSGSGGTPAARRSWR